MKVMPFVLAAAFLAGVSVALAAEQTIHQAGKKFSESELTVKKGDTLVFLNDDTIVHNVLSTTPGHIFNLGTMPPGQATPITFQTAGELKILCAIHPTMKMNVKVTE